LLSVGISLTQRKYVLDLLFEIDQLLGSYVVDNPMGSTVKLDFEQGQLYIDVS